MIIKLRRRHRRLVPVFLGLLPAVVLIGAIAGRPSAPVIGALPVSISASVAAWSERTSLGRIWDGIGLEASFGRTEGGPQLIVEIGEAPLKPDLLLFWSPAEAEVRPTPESSEHDAREADGGQIPMGSVLLGVFRDTKSAVFDLPERTMAAEGRLVLYSLPYRQVVSVSKPVTLN